MIKKMFLVSIVFVFLCCFFQSVSYAFLPFLQQKEEAPQAQPAGEPPRAIPAAVGPKKLIAVAEFENKTNWSGQVNLGTGMADQLITSLMNSGRFIVLERESIEAVLREQDFGASGRTTAEGGAKIGHISRAQILIQGAITEFGSTESSGGAIAIKGFSLGGKQSQAQVGIDLRIYDTTTGQILASKACRGVAKSSGSSIGYSGGDFGFATGGEARTPMDFAVRAAIDQALLFIIAELDRVPWQGRVAMVKDDLVYINVGRTAGINTGDQFNVYREGEAIVDPDTGVSLGTEDTKIGRIEVMSVDEKFSKAAPINGMGFEKNDIVKFE